MRKLRFVMLFVMLAFITACVSQEEILSILDDAKTQVDVIPMTQSDLDLIKQVKVDNFTVFVQWSSNNEDVIDALGNVTRPSFEQGSQLVTLTATLSLSGESIVRTFLVLVPALDPVVLVTVTFDSLGGSNVAPQTLDAGMKLLPYITPIKEGYVFAGWFLDEELVTAFDEDQVIMANTTLYAGYTKATYNVMFESNGGSVVQNQTVEHGSVLVAPTQPVKEGYTFLNWYTNMSLTTLYDFDTLVVESKTLYAAWELNTYTITFDTDGGSAVSQVEVNHGALVTQPNDPTQVGYTFVNWYADANFSLLYDFDSIVTEDSTVYAKWELNTYDVTFETDGGTSVAALEVLHGAMITAPSVPTKVGYVFVNWFADALTTTLYDFDAVVTEDITLYAKWQINTYNVVFNVDGGTSVPTLEVEHGALVTQPQNPTKDGFDFVNWYSDAQKTQLYDFGAVVTSALTLYAAWEEIIISFDVIFDTNGGSAVATQEVVENQTAVRPTDPTKDGFDFINWYSNVELTVLYDFDAMVTGTLTLYADWEEAEEVPAGTAITTPQEFMTASADGSTSSVYYLANDLDFTGITWNQTGTGTSFRGIMNGNGKTISNVTIVGAAANAYTGLFQRVNGATVHDITVDTISITNGRSGVLAGRVENNTFTATNIKVLNATVVGTDSNGVGGLIGNASLPVVLTNIHMENVHVSSNQKNVAVIIGRSDNAVTITDLFVKNGYATSSLDTTDLGVGGVIGYTNAATAVIVLNRVVFENVTLHGRSSGALVAYYRVGTLTVTDAFLNVNFTYAGSQTRYNGLVGNRVAATASAPDLTRVFGSFSDPVAHDLSVPLASENDISLVDLDQAWWTTNLPAFSQSSLWVFNAQSNFYTIA